MMAVKEDPYPSIRKLAPQLLVEEGPWSLAVASPDKATQVFESLQISFAMFAGADGFSSLLRRAVALATVSDPSLRQIKVSANGSLQGLEQASHDAVLAVIEQFLGLLVTFVGESLTLRLVGFAWPGDSLGGSKNTRSFP